VTVTIIIILMALAVGGFDFVKQKQANDQAKIQISLLSNAIEEYKLDNGSYPAGDGTSAANNNLFRVLFHDAATAEPPEKIYVSQLDPDNNKQGWTEGTGENVAIVDPWGEEYIYRRGDDATARNPDFDLISKGKDGQENTPDDIRN
jgi:type II secretory pathway pseudopilin PulG